MSLEWQIISSLVTAAVAWCMTGDAVITLDITIAVTLVNVLIRAVWIYFRMR